MKVLLNVFVVAAAALVCRGENDAGRIAGPGSEKAGDGEFPWMVNIHNKQFGHIISSGILLKSKVVLTVSHWHILERRNYEAQDIIVNVGMLQRLENEPTSQWYSVDKIVLHPRRERVANNAPFALLRLAKEPRLSYRVRPFGLNNIASTKEDYELARENDNCVVPGFGVEYFNEVTTTYPREMLKYRPEMKSQKFCENAIFGYKKSQLLCSANMDRTSACMYDWGAPLLCETGDRTKLFGLVYRIYGCTEGMIAYAKVSTRIDWIMTNVKMLQRL